MQATSLHGLIAPRTVCLEENVATLGTKFKQTGRRELLKAEDADNDDEDDGQCTGGYADDGQCAGS